ncbi:MAG: hypothetical protein ACI9R3_005231 [Verrucomicrobiales bacterium]|jgi:hypothetical protein
MDQSDGCSAVPPIKPQRFRGLVVLGCAFCAVIGFVGGIGPKWIAYREVVPDASGIPDAQHEKREFPKIAALSLPVSSTVQRLMDHSERLPHSEIVNHSNSNSLNLFFERWEQITVTPSGEVQIPQEVEELLLIQRPMTSLGIRNAIGRLPLDDRLRCWAAIIAHARIDECPAVLDRAIREPISESVSRMLISMVARHWAQTDPQGAFEAFRVPLPTSYGAFHAGIEIAAQEWFKIDEVAALDTVEKIANDEQRHRLLAILLPVASDKMDALERASRSGRPSFREVALLLAKSQPEDILRIAKQEPSRVPGEIFAVALGMIARTDLNRAISEWKQMSEGRERWLAMHAIVQEWAEIAPQKAFEWTSSEVASKFTAELRVRVLRRWIQLDPAAARSEAVKFAQWSKVYQ